MYDPTFMRQVALAIHSDRVRDHGEPIRIRSAAPRMLIHRALSLYRRSNDRSRAKPNSAERQTLLSD